MKRSKKALAIVMLAALPLLAYSCPAEDVETGELEELQHQPADTPAPHQPEELEEAGPPEFTIGWTSHANSRLELSWSHPGEWFGPADFPDSEGAYLKDPDNPFAFLMRFVYGESPAALAEAWGVDPIGITGLLEVNLESTTPTDPVTVSRIESPSVIGEGEDMTAQVAFVQRPDDILELTWMAPSDQWDTLLPTFQQILDSIEVWQVYSDQEAGMQTMYLHDWAEPTAPWQGEGVWFQSAADTTGLVIFIEPLSDPQAAFDAWDPSDLEGLGFSDCFMEEADDVDRISAIQGQWETKEGDCAVDATEARYRMAYAPDGARLLKIVLYAPVTDWDYAAEILRIMLAMLSTW